MATKHLFIVTYGRTGSTLLQGILNAHPGIRIFGENSGFLYFLFRAIRALQDSQQYVADKATDRPDHPFYGSSSVDVSLAEAAIVDVARRFLEERRDSARVVGFKEVRYDMPDVGEYLRWLDKTFPGAMFVVLTRPIADVKASGFWKGVDERLLGDRIEFLERSMASLAADGDLKILFLTYDDVSNGSGKVADLLRELDVAPDRDAISEVLQRPHSYALESVIFYDNSRLTLRRGVLEANFLTYRFDFATLDAGRKVITGTLLPNEPEGRIEKVWLERESDSADRHFARLGLPSPQLIGRYPDHPLSARALFELPLSTAPGVFRMFASTSSGTLELASLLSQPRATRLFAE